MTAAVAAAPSRLLSPLISDLQTAAGTVTGTLKTIQVPPWCTASGSVCAVHRVLCAVWEHYCCTDCYVSLTHAQDVKSTLRLTNDELRSLGQQLATAPVLTAKLLAGVDRSVAGDSVA